MTAPTLTGRPRPEPKDMRLVKFRILLLASLAVAACSKEGSIAQGGIYITRSTCPQVGIPAGTGDITLFSPAGRTDAAAIDVVAAMTNVRATCTEDASHVVSTASFDVVATRRDAGEARQVTLPYYNVVAQGGADVVAKKVGYVALSFPAGGLRAQTRGQVTARVARSAVALPEDVRRELTRVRRVGDADAAVDPLSKPEIREAVARATFEQLIGFQLTQAQLQYNATR
jgi:hypothetical protein